MIPLRSVRRGHGFTLVELMVVLAILASLALLAVPWFVKLAQRNAIKSAAREISITLAAARMTAVRRNAPVSVVIASVTPPIQLDTIEPIPPAPTPTRVPQTLLLPKSAAQFVETPSSPGGIMTFGGDGRLANFPVTTPAVIIVEGPVQSAKRNQITIRTNASGRIEVITPVDWK